MNRALHPTASAPRPATSAPRPNLRVEALACLALAVIAFITFRGALGYFFSQDDFEGLARARGLLPRLPGPWRLLSNQLYFDGMRAIADLNPFAYHLASLLAHALVTVLAFRYLRAWVAVPAALIGAGFFAVHPALFTALYWISAGSTIHSAAFGLLALLAERRDDRRRWLAVPCYALALLARETAIGLPLVMIAARLQTRRASMKDPVLASLIAVAIVFVSGMMMNDVIGLTQSRGAGAAYGAGIGPHVLANLATYLAWSTNFLLATVRSFSDAVDPGAVPIALVIAAVAIGGAALRPLRVRGWIVAWTLFAVWIAPVLVLQHHTYHYYLYGPLIGIGWSVAIAFDSIAAMIRRRAAARAAREGSSTFAFAIAAMLSALLAWNGAALVRKVEFHPFDEGLRSDPTVDRAIIAGNVHASLAATPLPSGVTLRFWSPMSIGRQQSRDPGAPDRESYWEGNVRAAILDGLGVRVLFPQVRAVEFVRRLSPVRDSTWYAVYRPDGGLGLASYALLDSLERANASVTP